MTDSATETFDGASAPVERRWVEEFVRGPALAVAVLWMVVLAAVYQALLKAERDHLRGELLAAYRRRRHWKKSDVKNLKSLGVNNAALKRMDRLVGTGRPVVPPHRPFDEAVLTKISAFLTLFGDDGSADNRKQALRQWPWWPHYLEALYRGEHALAKEQGIPGPSDYAERLVGRELGISPATLHRICGEIRRKRKEWDGAADFPPITLSEFRDWMEAKNFGVARLG